MSAQPVVVVVIDGMVPEVAVVGVTSGTFVVSAPE
jgi:hypothetical protein